MPLVPTQLISSAGDFAIIAILLVFSKKAKKVGDVGALYLLLYGIGRFSVEFLRQNEQGGFGPFTTAQLISFAAMAASVILFIRNRKSRNAENYQEEFKNKMESIIQFGANASVGCGYAKVHCIAESGENGNE